MKHSSYQDVFKYMYVLIVGIFHISYAQERLNCTRSYFSHGGRGVIESPNFPFHYRDNLSCNFSIHLDNSNPSTSQRVCFTFRRFEVEDEFDFFEVRLGGKLCRYTGHGFRFVTDSPSGDCPPHVWPGNMCFTTDEDHIRLQFLSDQHVVRPGFYANYTVIQVDNRIKDSPGSFDEYTPCATSNRWTCFNRKCVFYQDKCNDLNDCGDDSDEVYAHARCSGREASGRPNILACDFQDRSACRFDGIGHGWVIDSKSESRHRGPQMDHTIGRPNEGAYTRTKFWGIQAPEDITLFDTSYYFDPDHDYCLSFYYHMMGRDVGRLQVDLQFLGANFVDSIWSRVGNYSNRWIRAEIPITGRDLRAFSYAKFKATRGGDYYTHLAMDDFSVADGKCRGEDISCNFELGTCEWAASPGLHRAAGTGSNYGPHSDTSSQDSNGFYLMRFNDFEESVENLTSPVITLFSPHVRVGCLIFWQYLNPLVEQSQPIGMMKKRYNNGSIANWTAMRSQSKGWREWKLDITEDEPFQLIFEWNFPPSSPRAVAIDQISLLEGECRLLDLRSCSPQEYRCGTGNCIPIARACDGVRDCIDGADEEPEACCTLSACPEGMFCCRNQKCVDGNWECDGDNDCGDWSDENHCLAREQCPRDAADERFLCMDNIRCISRRYICNGQRDCEDGSDEEGCPGALPYVSPAVLAIVVVLGLILIALIFVKLGLAIKNGTCRLRSLTRSRSGGDEEEANTPPPFSLSQYQLPPDYSDAVSNPAYRPTTPGEKRADEGLPPGYDRVIKGEFVQLKSPSRRDIELLRERLEHGALQNTEDGYQNDGYVSDSDIALRPRLSRSSINMNLTGNGDLVGVSDSHYIQPPGEGDAPPAYISRPASRQASIRDSIRRTLRRRSTRRHREEAAIEAVPSTTVVTNPSHLIKLESRILRSRRHSRRGDVRRPSRAISAPDGARDWISIDPFPSGSAQQRASHSDV